MATEHRFLKYMLLGDAARTSIKDDEFALKNTVIALAKTLTEQISIEGYVLGIQGAWGSGKSSFANFVAEEIKARAPAHQIIRFEPWLIGEKSAILATFLGQLAQSIDKAEGAQSGWWRIDYWIFRRARKSLSTKVRMYGEYAALLATPAGTLASSDPTGAMALTAVGLKAIGYLKKLVGGGPSLDELKLSIAADLRRLQKKWVSLRFVVIVDDTDRLEPLEAMEVLRLVRKVANFPLVTYLVCFDQSVLSKQVCVAASIENGGEFVEKIFQNSITIPPQEPFALRRYLHKLLIGTFQDELGSLAAKDHDVRYREHVVLDVWAGRFMRTPRDVIRLYEAAKLGWPHVPPGSDFLDFIWLQLVKLKCAGLYEWTQRYLTEVASYRDAGRPGDNEPTDQAVKLSQIMKDFGWEQRAFHSGLGNILPGVDSFVLDGEKRRVFEFATGELARFEAKQRLGSPTHWRQYFAFDLPTYALPDEYISVFRKATTDDVPSAARMLRELLGRPHQKKGHFVDVLLDRLWDVSQMSGLPAAEAVGIASAFVEVMDEMAERTQEFEKSGRSAIWEKSVRLLTKDVAVHFLSIVETGKSLNWLAEVVRDQGFSHGLPEGNRKDSDRQWLNQEQLQTAIASITHRFKGMTADAIFAKPSPLDILFCWLQLGNKDDARAFVDASIQSDDGLVNWVSAMRGWSSSNVGVRHPVHKNYIHLFADAEAVKARLQQLANSAEVVEALKSRALALLADWEDRY